LGASAAAEDKLIVDMSRMTCRELTKLGACYPASLQSSRNVTSVALATQPTFFLSGRAISLVPRWLRHKDDARSTEKWIGFHSARARNLAAS